MIIHTLKYTVKSVTTDRYTDKKIQNGMDTLIISNECSLLYNLYYDMPVINNIHSKH